MSKKLTVQGHGIKRGEYDHEDYTYWNTADYDNAADSIYHVGLSIGPWALYDPINKVHVLQPTNDRGTVIKAIETFFKGRE